jgi:hypothetical protein
MSFWTEYNEMLKSDIYKEYRRLNQENKCHELFVDDYRIIQRPSVYSKRNNGIIGCHYDICIWKAHNENYGALVNGRYYSTALVMACETGKVLSGHKSQVDGHILENLTQWGFDIKEDN